MPRDYSFRRPGSFKAMKKPRLLRSRGEKFLEPSASRVTGTDSTKTGGLWASLKSPAVQWQFAYAVLVVFCALIAIGSWMTFERFKVAEFRTESREYLTHDVDALSSRLEREISGSGHMIHGLAAGIAIEPDITQSRFGALATQVLSRHPEIRHLAAAPDLVIKYIHPIEGNKAALGLDYRGTPDQLRAIERAKSMEHGVTAGPVDLVQGGQGFISRLISPT